MKVSNDQLHNISFNIASLCSASDDSVLETQDSISIDLGTELTTVYFNSDEAECNIAYKARFVKELCERSNHVFTVEASTVLCKTNAIVELFDI